MAERTRKLHVLATPQRVEVLVCQWNVGETREQLVSSRDGVVACEVFRPGDPRAPYWHVRAKRALDVPTDAAPVDLARAAFYALAEPDVAAIHVVDPLGLERTFVRDCAHWLDVPRFPHPVYRVTPRAA